MRNYDDIFSNINAECCAAVAPYNQSSYTANANATWTSISNPFSNSNPVLIQNELRIPTGKDVTIKGMLFQFGPTAKVVIEKGARLILDNSTLTSIECENMWQGIELQGISTENQYAQNPGGLRKQGHLIITNNSLIENAKEAITVWTQGLLNTTGGIVWATNSTFRNNWRCAEFIRYQNYLPIANTPTTNLSYFKDCVFETTNDLLNNGQSPLVFVSMWAVDGVGFRGNIFRNTSGQTDVNKRGIGIKSIDAKYAVQSYCTTAIPYGTPCPSANLVRNHFEKLAYGIDASASNSMNTVTISNNDFNNNWRGVLLRGIDFATVTENDFNVGASASQGQSYGLYTDDCSGYKVEGNNFFSTHGGFFGTYTSWSGTAPNRIYRNTFNNLVVGSAAGGNNGETTISPQQGKGLEYRCNAYNCSLVDIGVLSGGIALHQGYCHVLGSNPAGNTFTQNNAFNLFKNPNALTFHYFFHNTGGIYEPRTQAISPFIVKTDVNCAAYNASSDCKSTLVSNPGVIKSERQALITSIGQIKSVIDGGNTASLIASLSYLSNGQAKNAMMAVSPYASDAALLAYLAANRPAGHIQQVVSANSPVSSNVWGRIEQMNLPTGIRNQLTAMQVGTSERTKLEGLIVNYEKEIWLLTDDLIRFYLNDTIVPNPMDTVIMLLKEQDRQRMKCQQLAAEIKAGKYTDADATVAEIRAVGGGQITSNYCKLLNILLELAKHDATCLNMATSDENTIRDVAADETQRGCAHAKALLDAAFSQSFPEVIEELQLTNPVYRQANSIEVDASEELLTEEINQPYSLIAYPNPFSEVLTVKATLPKDVQKAEFVLFDVMGQELKRINLQSGESIIEIQGNELKEGLLFYALVVDRKVIATGKTVHLKF